MSENIRFTYKTIVIILHSQLSYTALKLFNYTEEIPTIVFTPRTLAVQILGTSNKLFYSQSYCWCH